MKPVRNPYAKATAGRTKQFQMPLEITVNNHLIRRINTNNSKYRLCARKSKVNGWQPNTERSPPCITILNVLVPIEVEVPINVESIVLEDAERQVEQDIDVEPLSKSAKQSYDGSEKSFARTQNNYYRSQLAIGDPIRSKRNKRTSSGILAAR